MILSEFLNLFKQGKVSAHSHMKNLIEMAMADGRFDDSEEKFLLKLASKHGVSKKKIEEIRNNEMEVEFVLPSNEKEKFNQLFELVNMMVIDQHIDHSELRLCVMLARKFGYTDDKVEELVDSIASNITNGHTLDETRKRIKWLLN